MLEFQINLTMKTVGGRFEAISAESCYVRSIGTGYVLITLKLILEGEFNFWLVSIQQ